MKKARSYRIGSTSGAALVLVISGLVAGSGVQSASADDGDPTGTPTASETPSESSSPTLEPAATPTPAPTPVTAPAAPAPAAPQRIVGGRVDSTFTPADGITFNYPYAAKSARYAIRSLVVKTIAAVPSGGSIRIAAYSINDARTVKKLIQATRRGVSVQVVVNSHNIHGTPNHGSSPSFKHLVKVLSSKISRPGQDPEAISFAKICKNSCRGSGGNVHYKMFLFSSAGGADGTAAQYVTMTGSPNLTLLAAQGQWNHLITYSNQQTYDRYKLMFNEMKLDTRANPVYRDYEDITPPTWFFPHPGQTASDDPQLIDLKNIRCDGVTPGYGDNGRTLIRIGQYAWFGDRGNYLARQVRGLWDAGCNIAVEYAVIGVTVKKILYNPAGRGRIPMRQVATFGPDGTVRTYDHAKWITVNGAYGASSGTTVTWTGTTNWTNLGNYSDDFTQRWADNPGLEAAFRASFDRIWRGPKSHVPSPKSHTPKAVADRIPLGTGKYALMESN